MLSGVTNDHKLTEQDSLGEGLYIGKAPRDPDRRRDLLSSDPNGGVFNIIQPAWRCSTLAFDILYLTPSGVDAVDTYLRGDMIGLVGMKR